MDERKIKLSIGSILHDFGKLLYRYNDHRNHSTSGYDFIKEIDNFEKEYEILNCIRYHHSAILKFADIASDSLCYITYIADNIASFSDRRRNETGDSGFVRDISYVSIFNILNGNNDTMSYSPAVLSDEAQINYPSTAENVYSESFYAEIIDKIKDKLRGLEYTYDYLNSFAEILEAYTSYIPSSTQIGEIRDISLFNHLKLTAAISACIYDYMQEHDLTDFKTELFNNSEHFYDQKAFILYSTDISGIQNFIYNISSKSALKGLRSRSFYLEIIMESAIDDLLERLELSRCNVIYSGGGHTYMLLPCTEKVKEVLSMFESELNKWFIDNFGIELYVGTGYCECSANELRNTPDGSFKNVFRAIGKNISIRKIRRYSAQDIIKLNSSGNSDGERECSICNRVDRLIYDELNNTYICEICNGLKKLSDGIIFGNFFTVLNEKDADFPCIILPFNKYLITDNFNGLLDRMKNDERYVRCYCKNKMYSGYRLASKLWIGDYSAEKKFEDLADKSNGIRRIAVLRADVDNLGQTFVSGFDDKYITLSRSAELSKKLSIFFKHHINIIMQKCEFFIGDHVGEKRNAVIIYSGGDDVFVVGGWDDVIGFAVDLRNAFKRFTQGTLTISAGIGLYTPTYPIYAMAEETGRLEDISKNNEGKDSVTLFDKENCYHWDEFIDNVVGEKLAMLNEFFGVNNEKGNSMLYNILNLIRCRNDQNRLNIARFAYYLARMAPDCKECSSDTYEIYKKFSGKMYSWIQNEKDSKELITAIYLYVYINRSNTDDVEVTK